MAAQGPTDGKGRKRRSTPGEEHLVRREGSPTWHIDFTVDGHRIRESSGTEAKAKAAALALKRYDEVWREVKLGEKPRRDLTVMEAFGRFYAEVSKGTSYGERGQKYHMRLLLEALGANTLLADLDDDRIARLVQHFRTRPPKSVGFDEGVSGSTINRYITTLSVVCRRAKDVWGVQVGPWRKGRHVQAEPRGREVFLEHREAKALLDALVPHAHPIVLLALLTGMRRENVVQLAWENVSLDMGRAVMIQKGDRPLSVELTGDAVHLLQRIEPDASKRVGPVWRFGNPSVPCTCSHCRPKRNHGKPIRSIRRSFTTAAKAAGLRSDEGKFRFHDIRHSFASWLLDATGDLRLVQEALGHRHIQTTARYAHLIGGRKRAAIEDATAGLFQSPTVKKETA